MTRKWQLEYQIRCHRISRLAMAPLGRESNFFHNLPFPNQWPSRPVNKKTRRTCSVPRVDYSRADCFLRFLRRRLLRSWLLGSSGGLGSLHLAFTSANQGQGVRCVEWELPHRGFRRTRGLQSDVHTTVARQFDDLDTCHLPLPLFGGQFGVVHHRLLHFLKRQVAFLSVGLGFDGRVRNALFDQVALHSRHATLGERLVVSVG